MSRLPQSLFRYSPTRRRREGKYSNYCLEFNGSTQYVQVPSDPSLDETDTLTWAFWIQRARWGVAAIEGILSRFLYDNPSQYFIYFPASSDSIQLDIPWVATIITSIRTIRDSLWHRVVITKDGDNYALYIDGKLDNTAVNTSAMVVRDLPLIIGSNSALNRFFQGRLDEVMIINRAWSYLEVMEDWYRGYARRENNSAVNLRFEEGGGLVAHDDGPIGNDGDLLPAEDPPSWTRVKKHELLAEAGV